MEGMALFCFQTLFTWGHFVFMFFLNEKKNVSRIGNNRVGDKSIGKNKFANVFKKKLLKQIKSQYAFSSENSLANEPIFGG